jgi:hypothetical protein
MPSIGAHPRGSGSTAGYGSPVIQAVSIVPFVLCGAGALVIGVAWAADRTRRPRPQHPERRRLPRSESAAPVVVRRDGRDDDTFAIDLTGDGILIAGPADLASGDSVTLLVDGAARDATVLRSTPQGYKALRFD